MVERLNCSNNDFIHTTEQRHHRASIAIWEEMEAAGDIYLDKYAGWYSVRDEAYYAEGETHVSEQKQRIATKTGTPVEWVEEESYFFRLSAYQQKLLALYERVPDFVLPRERLNEVASFVRGGLQDLSISRTTFDWGVKVPGNAEHKCECIAYGLPGYRPPATRHARIEGDQRVPQRGSPFAQRRDDGGPVP